MKYMICIDRFEKDRLIGKSMRLIAAPDNTILIDAAMHMIAADNKLKRNQLSTISMPVPWIHNNLPNSTVKGCVKIREIGTDVSVKCWILYYKQIRDHDVVRIKEGDYNGDNEG